MKFTDKLKKLHDEFETACKTGNACLHARSVNGLAEIAFDNADAIHALFEAAQNFYWAHTEENELALEKAIAVLNGEKK